MFFWIGWRLISTSSCHYILLVLYSSHSLRHFHFCVSSFVLSAGLALVFVFLVFLLHNYNISTVSSLCTVLYFFHFPFIVLSPHIISHHFLKWTAIFYCVNLNLISFFYLVNYKSLIHRVDAFDDGLVYTEFPCFC